MQCCGVRLASPRSKFSAGTPTEAGVLQLQRRMAGLFGIWQPTAYGGLAVSRRVSSAGCSRGPAGAAERDADPAAVRTCSLPPGHPQHGVPLCGRQRGGQDLEQRRASASR